MSARRTFKVLALLAVRETCYSRTVDTAHIILSALLTNSAALAQIWTALEYLHNAEPLLENFRNYVYIQHTEEWWFLKSSW